MPDNNSALHANTMLYVEYLDSCKSNYFDTYNTTYRTYEANFKLFVLWLSRFHKNRLLLSKDTLKDMPKIMEEYRNYCREKLGNNKRTLMNKTTAISSFYSWCVRRGKCKAHPFTDRLEKLKINFSDRVRKNYFLTPEDILTVRLYMQVETKKYDIQDRLLWEIFIDSACRISAVQNLKFSQLNLNEGYFENVKEKEGYIVNAIFFDKAKALLEEWIKIRKELGITEDWVFISKYNGTYHKMTQSTIRARIHKIGKIINIPHLYPHTLRKTTINLLNNLGGLSLASSYANHLSSDVTSRHYIQGKSPTEVRNTVLNMKKKIGII